MAVATAPAVAAPMAPPFRMRAIMAPLVAIIVGVFMVILDGTAVNVALPGLVKELHSSLTMIQWTVTGYALAQAAVIPLAGWLSDRFGAKPIFLLSVALFTLGSALCATAQSDGMLIVFRLLQGLGGGCVAPIGMAYVYRLSPPERVGAVMGVMGIPILLAPALGPVLAGWLVQYAVWRWIFLLNLPVGILGLAIGLRSLPAIGRQSAAALDLPGALLAPLAFAALSYGISQGGASWTSPQTLGGLAVGGVALASLAVVELRARAPLLELRVFRAAEFCRATVVQWVAQFALFGALFLAPLFLQQARGYGAFETGLLLLPQALAAAIIMPLSGGLFDRIGARPLVLAGMALVAVATLLLGTVSASTQGIDLILPLALLGAGMGLMMMPLNTHLINAAPRRLVSRVTALTNALQQVVNSLTIAGLATLLTSRATLRIDAAKAAFAANTPSAPATSASTPDGLRLAHDLQAAIATAFATAFADAFHVMVVAALVAGAMGLLLRSRQASPADSAAVDTADEAAPYGVAVPG